MELKKQESSEKTELKAHSTWRRKRSIMNYVMRKTNWDKK